MAPDPLLPNDPADDPETYTGLARQDAEEQARARGWTTVRSLAPGTVITMEYLSGRLNFEVEDGRVRRAWKG
ncbi:I78 family peptidase inhibitor [Streptomyces halobius]|uniref:Proteinase inhibitor I78 n=1 Tax=Streptomyces halobius TaxID=2879846 RepID=A0ABY4MGP3_9ACTN|nr:I78 family peptidase inhibitor [Streptomyces halobius]UQA96268.1 proteinase inhibitor I78 [Streptomyces halobius]